jgi:hypothetical protein
MKKINRLIFPSRFSPYILHVFRIMMKKLNLHHLARLLCVNFISLANFDFAKLYNFA